MLRIHAVSLYQADYNDDDDDDAQWKDEPESKTYLDPMDRRKAEEEEAKRREEQAKVAAAHAAAKLKSLETEGDEDVVDDVVDQLSACEAGVLAVGDGLLDEGRVLGLGGGLEDEGGVRGGVQGLEFAHGLKVAGVCDDLGELLELFELRWVTHKGCVWVWLLVVFLERGRA